MKPYKIIAFCFIAFAIPVLFAVVLVPDFFSHKTQKDVSDIKSQLTSEQANDALTTDVPKSFVEVPSALELDPAVKGVFIASVKFAVSKFPEEGQSIRFFTKYDQNKWPHAGWGMKIKKQAGSIRPEVYWMGSNARGGWYSFGEIEIKENHWNTLTLVAEGNNSISLFFQDLTLDSDYTGISLPKFLGGFTVSEIPLPINNGQLVVMAPVSSKISDELAIHDLLIARLERLDGAVLKLIDGGPSELAQKMDSNLIGLWIDARARDRSSFARKVTRIF